MTLGSADLVAFVAATDLGRAREFYEHVLGLTVVDDNPFACVFDTRGTTLRVTKVDAPRTAGYTVLGWETADIAAVMHDLAARGVTFDRFPGMTQDDLGIWETPTGDRVAWFEDPDGNTLSLTQTATPSATG